MTTIKQIAQDPRKALKELEIGLGANPGDLLREMERLSPPGEGWDKHLPYRLAASYYDDEGARTSFQSHVDECDYCKTLLETLHPTSLDAVEFASKAKHMHAPVARDRSARVSQFALAASVLLGVVLSGTFFARSQSLASQVRQLRAEIDAQPSGLVASGNSIPTVTAATARQWVGDIKLRSGADPTMAVTAAEPTFHAGEPVHVTTAVANAPSHTPVSVVWVGPDNKEVRKEINWTRAGQTELAFTAPATSTWKSGEYRAELWVADKKVRQAQFDIEGAAPTEIIR
jgi:outer membrane murein-binding lipoprotein Lpp